jgi:hypothetical protein
MGDKIVKKKKFTFIYKKSFYFVLITQLSTTGQVKGHTIDLICIICSIYNADITIVI